MPAANVDAEKLIKTLLDHQVKFVVVGGYRGSDSIVLSTVGLMKRCGQTASNRHRSINTLRPWRPCWPETLQVTRPIG